MICYDSFWKIIKEKKISQYSLINYYGISPSTIRRLKNNENVSTSTIEILTKALNCSVNKILSFY